MKMLNFQLETSLCFKKISGISNAEFSLCFKNAFLNTMLF
jgi:hypothetical protein